MVQHLSTVCHIPYANVKKVEIGLTLVYRIKNSEPRRYTCPFMIAANICTLCFHNLILPLGQKSDMCCGDNPSYSVALPNIFGIRRLFLIYRHSVILGCGGSVGGMWWLSLG
jgi:hypothetical protein